MGIKGRKPKHPGLEAIDGGRGKKAVRLELEAPTEYPAMPAEWRKADGNEQPVGHPKLWEQLREVFKENGTPIRSSDIFAIEELCDLIASVRYLRKRVANQHTVAGDRNKYAVKSHPMVAELKANRDALWRAFERFGLTPVDAGRLPLKSKVRTPHERVMEGFEDFRASD